MKRLAGMVGLVAAGTVVFSVSGDAMQPAIDAGILTYVAVVYTIGIGVMLWWTRQWSVIGCGLLATMTGDALLYARLSEHLPVPGGAWTLDVARSCFIVGSTYLVIGLVLWMRDQRGSGDDAMLTGDGAT